MLIAAFVGLAFIETTNAFADPVKCPENIDNKKPALAFSAFQPKDLHHPDGTPVQSMSEKIDILDEAGKVLKTMPAGDFLIELNDFEEKLNQSGYSLRNPSGNLIGGLYTCLKSLETQAQKTQEMLRKDLPLTQQLDQYMPRFDESWKRYKADIPSWDELKKRSNDVNYDVYIPEKPPLAIVAPIRLRTELKPLIKERPWPFNWGEGKDFNIFGKANLSVKASKIEATANGTLEVSGKIVGKDVGEILGIIASAESPGSDSLRAGVEVRVIGKKLLNFQKSGLSIREDNKVSYPVDWATEYRFAIGFVPMRARLGLQGSLGIMHGFAVMPLRLGAYAKPFARSNAYAQVGADIAIGGVGVGGELTLINLDVPLTADVNVEWDDEPEIKLALRGTAEVNTLSGRLYAYAYAYYPKPWPPWKDKWTGEWDFFKWDGLSWKGNLFEYEATYTSAGLVAKGDLKAEDVAEVQAITNEIQLTQLKDKANQYNYAVLKAVTEDLSNPEALNVIPETESLKSLWTSQSALLSSYQKELLSWIQRS
jgi:hypothetical protein